METDPTSNVLGTGPAAAGEMAATTEHTTARADGTARRVAVDHAFYEAVQFELYLPTALWEHPAVQSFFRRINAVEAGATLFPGATGVWMGRPEGTTVYRKIVRRGGTTAELTRRALRGEVGRLMADLSSSAEHAQQAILVTEAVVHVSLSTNLRPTDGL